MLLWLCNHPASGETPDRLGTIVVVYPDTSSPSKEVYGLIRAGIRSELHNRNFRTLEQTIDSSNHSPQQSLRLIEDVHPYAIISLGRAGYESVASLSATVPLIVGGIQINDRDPLRNTTGYVTSVSLTANPKYVLEALRELAPQVRRVFVPYNPQRNASLIEAARSVSRTLNMSLMPVPASNLNEASAAYRNVFKSSSPQTDALWLLDGDDLVDLDATLPSIIETAWTKRFALISNVPEYARRGALLATFPDARALGTRLASLAIARPRGKRPEILWGEDIVYIVNARAGSHLGIDINVFSRKHRDNVFAVGTP
jgi:ABC-type uncharacterized transport system substrate-binding protein